MSISERQYRGILKVIEHLGSGLDSREIRLQAGMELLTLLRADYFASFVWHPDERRFTEHVSINMDPDNLQRYCSYYQFHNPISAETQRLRCAVRVNDVIAQRELIKTEFYNDFLARDGLYHGLNLYVFDGDTNIGDLRVWRHRRHAGFEDADLQLMEMIKPHFCNAMRNIFRLARQTAPAICGAVERTSLDGMNIERLKKVHGLTVREAQVALEMAYGKTDQEIGQAMGISFSTIRTHINHLYSKVGVHNRAALARRICAPG